MYVMQPCHTQRTVFEHRELEGLLSLLAVAAITPCHVWHAGPYIKWFLGKVGPEGLWKMLGNSYS